DVLGRYPNTITICGNCDAPGTAEVEQTFDLLGVNGLITHGHTLHVKTSPLPLFYRAQELDARLTVFGHTHTPTLYVENGRVFLNPGSLSYPRGYTVCTYAIAEFNCDRDDDEASGSRVTANFTFYTLEGDPIPAFDLTHTY
ncbi:MAG TPA: YfcE family phosphodiesterase, partial [Bacilli bacterium]|nr:YfcE family phosphodiesterase [Bacilli bacterium]